MKKTVIIILDDMAASLVATKTWFEKNYSVYTFASSKDMFEALAKIPPPNLFILDYFMTEKNGHVVARDIKADKRYCDVPIVFLSVSYNEKGLLNIHDIDYAAYIIKPLDSYKVEIIKKIIEERENGGMT